MTPKYKTRASTMETTGNYFVQLSLTHYLTARAIQRWDGLPVHKVASALSLEVFQDRQSSHLGGI